MILLELIHKIYLYRVYYHYMQARSQNFAKRGGKSYLYLSIGKRAEQSYTTQVYHKLGYGGRVP